MRAPATMQSVAMRTAAAMQSVAMRRSGVDE
jgi:hypothetical protein